jgi:hypothetical protein
MADLKATTSSSLATASGWQNTVGIPLFLAEHCDRVARASDFYIIQRRSSALQLAVQSKLAFGRTNLHWRFWKL